MKSLILLLLGFAPMCAFSQKYDHVWMSGLFNPSDSLTTGNFTIDFKVFPPKIDRSNAFTTLGGENISLSDQQGILRYYSSGCDIRSWDHSVMENGAQLNGMVGDSSFDIFCVPNPYNNYVYPIEHGMFALPVSESLHDLFHLKVNVSTPGPNGACQHGAFMRSRMDLEANQGLGRVVFEDSLLLEGCFQTATANRHANGRDWWILLMDNVENRIYRFLNTPEGLQGPWEQWIENPTIYDSFFFRGNSEFSPNGEHLLINNSIAGTAVYDFDRCTGLLSNLRFMPTNFDQFYGLSAAFSPDSRLLYVTRGSFTTIEQHDLNATDLWNSRVVIANWDGYRDTFPGSNTLIHTFFTFFQHGPDGKLYIWAGDTRYVHTIDYPNRLGLACAVHQRAIKLPTFMVGANLHYPHYRLGPIDGSTCDTLGIDNQPVALFRAEVEDTLQPLAFTFTDLSYYAPDTWHWDFGDGTSSTEQHPAHAFAQAGVYTVCLIASNVYAADTFCQTLVVGTVGTHNLPALPMAQVGPNPFSDELRIVLPAWVGVSPSFELFDLLGRSVASIGLHDFDTPIPLSGLSSGLYVWQIRWNGRVTQVGKVVKW